MAIFLTADSKVIVQGMTGSEGRKHTQLMLASGTDIVGGVTPGKGGQKVEFDSGVVVPVFGSVAGAVEATGAEYVTAVDPSCLMHLDGVLRFKNHMPKAIHIASILAQEAR